MNASFFGFSIPRWGAMWGIAFSLYGALKALTWFQRRPSAAPTWKLAAYLFAWPGMNADAFPYEQATSRPTVTEWTLAIVKFAVGLAMLFLLVPRFDAHHTYLVGLLGMSGIVVTLHFGLFHILSCVYRRLGMAAIPIMDCPIASRSVAELWGKRWNRAFRDLTYRYVFRPLIGVIGPAGALMAGFLFSGLAHDVVISIPAGKGYGLPTCYFLIQGCALLVERSRFGRVLGLARGMRGRIFCFVVALAPIGLLFHEPFVCRVMFPFLQALGLVP